MTPQLGILSLPQPTVYVPSRWSTHTGTVQRPGYVDPIGPLQLRGVYMAHPHEGVHGTPIGPTGSPLAIEGGIIYIGSMARPHEGVYKEVEQKDRGPHAIQMEISTRVTCQSGAALE